MEQNEFFGQNNDMTTALDMPEVPAAPQTEVLMDDAVMQAPAWEAPAAPAWEAPAGSFAMLLCGRIMLIIRME